MRFLRITALALGLTLLALSAVHAGNSGYRITDARGQQTNLLMTSDGKNSAICVWQDDRTGTSQVYAQSFDSLGAKRWAADGVPVSTTGTQVALRHVLTDSLGGAWLVYTSTANSQITLRVQHMDGAGICTAIGASAITTAVAGTAIGASSSAVPTSRALHVLYQWYNGAFWRWAMASLAPDGTLSWHSLDLAGMSFIYPYTGDVCADGIGGSFVIVGGNYSNNITTNIQHVDSTGTATWSWFSYSSYSGPATRFLPRSPESAYLARDEGNGYISVGIASTTSGPGGGGRIYLGDAPFVFTAHGPDGVSVLGSEWINTGGLGYRHSLMRLDDAGHLLRTLPLSSTAGSPVNSSDPKPSSATATSSETHIAWYDSRESSNPKAPGSLFVQRFLSTGIPAFALGGIPIRQASGQPSALSTALLGTRFIVSWIDPRRPNDSDAYVQIISADGSMVLPDGDAPRIAAVKDVRNDQGGHLSVSWQGSAYDDPGTRTITAYRVWRRLPPSAVANMATSSASRGQGSIRTTSQGSALEYWESIVEVPAQQLKGYGAVVATTQDSLPGSNPYTAFFVSALTSNAFLFYDSPVDSGYSVDNLPPRAPLFAGARYDAGANHLHWLPNTEADLNGYILYRGTHADFVTDVTDPVAFVSDTGYVDLASGPMYYKIAAIDRHGNRSPYITVLPTGNAGVGGGLSLAFSLGRPFPNPSDGSSLNVELTLPTAAPASLEVLDVSGRCVLRDDLAGYVSGRHTFDIAKRVRLASGLYVVRLQQAGMTRTIRATVLQ